MPPAKHDPGKDVRFGKILAVGMGVALIWGILLMVLGIYVRFKFGSILMELIGDVKTKANLQISTNEFGQQLVPYNTIPDDVNFGSWTKLLGAIIISSAILTILFAALGIYSGLNHNKLVLIVTVVILIVTAFLLLGIISILADVESSFHNEAREEMTEILKKEYTIETTDNGFVFAMNGMMIWFQCCGVSGIKDFMNITFVEQLSGSGVEKSTFKIAPACCKSELFNTPPVEKFAGFGRIKECAIFGNTRMQNINTKGCYNMLIEEAQGPGFALLSIILIWDVLVLVLAILTILEIKPEGDVHTSPSKEAEAEKRAAEKEKEEREVVVKKFVPYAKISSFVHPDINRIKSTEIW
ncbi:hypothetical protein BsWGS_17349 [Bradybaena similaris]